MDNSIVGIGASARTPLSYTARESSAIPANDAHPLAVADKQPRVIGGVEYMDDSTVSMQDRRAEREEKAKSSGYEHLGNAAATRVEPTASRRPAPTEETGGHAGLLGYHRTHIPEGFHERTSDAISRVGAQIQERFASLGPSETRELDAAALEELALQATAEWDALNAETQDRYSAAAQRATETGHDRLAARLSDQAEILDARYDSIKTNILEHSAELIDGLESGVSSPPAEAVDLHA